MMGRLCTEDGFFGLLDVNLLLTILEKLQNRIDRQNWCLIAKRFMLAEAAGRKKVELLRVEVLPGVLRRYNEATELDLTLCSGVDDRVLHTVGAMCGPRLQSVSLARSTQFTELGLQNLFSDCFSLRELDLTSCTVIGDHGMVAVAQLENLESLKLADCRTLGNPGLGCIAAGCKTLRSLSLRWCVEVSDASITLVAKNCKQLESLDLCYTQVGPRGLTSLAKLEFLKNLFLVGCAYVTNMGVARLKNCASLSVLDLTRCPVSDQGIKDLARDVPCLRELTLSYCLEFKGGPLASLQKFSSLQVVRFDGCEIGDVGLLVIARTCKSLTSLSLSKCKSVTDEGVQAVVNGCHDLHEIDLTCCERLTDSTVMSIAKSCRGLQVLKMEACSLLTCRGLGQLAVGCTALEELDLTDCNMDDEGLKSLARCTALRILKLGFCYDISDVGVTCIGASCCNLREMDLYRSLQIGDPSVAAIANGCPRLRVLNLSYCERITDASLHSISRLRDLVQLEIRACPKVTSSGVASVAAGCRQLIELDVKKCRGIDDEGFVSIARGCPNLRQINLSGCKILSPGLLALASLSCMQNMKLLFIDNVPAEGVWAAIVSGGSLKKVKLLTRLQETFPERVREIVERRGCRLRWMDKPSPPI